ncbi:fad dependent oxidoreductase [Trichoderma arundinaceum]|uniref:Fad dependent oxidoreductase n=1 Tax=Trichoderma arundinaceum TaxID=490622 RepID=A0A395NBF9_TRIAR|nr:fad dependent oxidoreductase [Trichoderma arundinaceum]
MRTVPGSINIPAAEFPSSPRTQTPLDLNIYHVVDNVVAKVNHALEQKSYTTLASLFTQDGYWRDHLALSWDFRTIHGSSRILQYLESCSGSRDGFRLQRITSDSGTTKEPKLVPIDAEGTVTGIQFFFTCKTVLGTGRGLARLVEEEDSWKFFTLYTRLEELNGFEEPIGCRRSKGVEHGGRPGRQNWAERRTASFNFESGDNPAVVIVGAGQAGLTAAARLKMLGVETLVIDHNDRVGDNWRKRYHQLVLHDPVWYDHMPYLNFPNHWPIFTPKDKLAEFFESYAALLELNVWTNTQLVRTKWDATKRTWTVVVNRLRADGTSQIRTFRPRHIIQATGHSGKKNQPTIKGQDIFTGLLCHSSEFPGAQINSAGKKAVVVGSCNSAHDIAQDYLEKGYDVTMIQRSTTHVVSSKAIMDIALSGIYSEDGPPVDDADMLIHGLPTPVLKAIQIAVAARQTEHDQPLLEGLAKVGFKVDKGPDGAGLLFKYFQRGGGYYINVGASELIAEGKIKVKQGQEIDEVLPNGIRFADGSELEASEVVFATGYQNMRTQTRIMFGDEVADAVGDVWGFNAEGEMRTIWQKSGHPGFWFHGGNLALCRYYSRLLALQIKGLEEGLYQYHEI